MLSIIFILVKQNLLNFVQNSDGWCLAAKNMFENYVYLILNVNSQRKYRAFCHLSNIASDMLMLCNVYGILQAKMAENEWV